MKSGAWFYFLICILVFTILVVPLSFRNGMFMDGLIYSSVARNLSIGMGDFWDLSYSSSGLNHFREHPPMAFWLQSFFFDIFGDHLLVERIYSYLMGIISLCLVFSLIRTVTERDDKEFSWIGMLFFISMPLSFWTFSNNMLENTLMVFCLSSVLFQVKYFISGRSLYLIYASVFLCLSFYTKGLVGLFPLAFPLCWYIVFKRDIFKALSSSFLIFICSASFIALIILIPGAYDFMFGYFSNQVMKSLNGELVVVERTFIIKKLLLELIGPGIIFLILILTSRYYKTPHLNDRYKAWAFVFLLLGLCATLPIMISPKQLRFYIVPALPFYAISLGLFAIPFLHVICRYSKPEVFYQRGITMLMILLFMILVISPSFIHLPGRDKHKIEVSNLIHKVLPGIKNISGCDHLIYDFALSGYLQRNNRISIYPLNSYKFKFGVFDKDCPYAENLEKVAITERFVIARLY